VVFGFEATGIQTAALQKMAGQKFFLLLPKDFGGALVGCIDVSPYLPVRQFPAFVGGVLANFIEFGALQQELHHLGDALVLDCFVGVNHAYLRIPQKSPRRCVSRLSGVWATR